MIRTSKITDEQREAGPTECWCLHGAVGSTTDWRLPAKALADHHISSRAVDLWRFLECQPMPLADFGKAINADVGGQVFRGSTRAIVGYSMGGRLALHSLLEPTHPWQAAIIIGAHPGLEDAAQRQSRAAADAEWASRVLMDDWQTFLTDWDAQPVLSSSAREPQTTGRLQMRRREIARSFVDWSLGNQQPLWGRLHEITIPVLWIVGEQDTKFLEIAQRATALMPNAQLAIAPATGHRVPHQSPAWLADEIARFLHVGASR